MKVLIEAEVIEEHESTLRVKINNGFGEPEIHVDKDMTRSIELQDRIVESARKAREAYYSSSPRMTAKNCEVFAAMLELSEVLTELATK